MTVTSLEVHMLWWSFKTITAVSRCPVLLVPPLQTVRRNYLPS